jgi:hypothetical protein
MVAISRGHQESFKHQEQLAGGLDGRESREGRGSSLTSSNNRQLAEPASVAIGVVNHPHGAYPQIL